MTTPGTPDFDAISRRLIAARGCIEGNSEPDDHGRGEQALRQVLAEDVDALLLWAERDSGAANFDRGYVTGLYAAAQWVAMHDRRTGYDQDTYRQFKAGLDAIIVAAADRLGVNPDGCESRDWPAGDTAAHEQVRRNEQIRLDGSLS